MRLFRMTTTVVHMTTAHDTARALAQAVREIIEARGYTQRDVAEGAGIPLTTLSRKLRGLTPLDAIETASLAIFLDTSLTDLALRADRITSRSAA